MKTIRVVTTHLILLLRKVEESEKKPIHSNYLLMSCRANWKGKHTLSSNKKLWLRVTIKRKRTRRRKRRGQKVSLMTTIPKRDPGDPVLKGSSQMKKANTRRKRRKINTTVEGSQENTTGGIAVGTKEVQKIKKILKDYLLF